MCPPTLLGHLWLHFAYVYVHIHMCRHMGKWKSGRRRKFNLPAHRRLEIIIIAKIIDLGRVPDIG